MGGKQGIAVNPEQRRTGEPLSLVTLGEQRKSPAIQGCTRKIRTTDQITKCRTHFAVFSMAQGPYA